MADSETQETPVQQEAPASNPGSDDPSGGIEKGHGGVSASAYVVSPVPSEQQSVTGAVMEKVSSALSYLGLGDGGEKTAKQHHEDESQHSSSGITTKAAEAGAAATATAGATVAAVTGSDSTSSSDQAGSQKEGVDKPTESAVLTTSGTDSKDTNMADSSEKDDEQKTTESTNESTENTGGSGESEDKKKPGHAGKENRDAIPTAGGERLGDKHWGESKIVPDVPKSESENVSSADGQPNQETKDNTAKNTGGASGGPDSGADAEGKPSLTDKIKDKLPFGKKE